MEWSWPARYCSTENGRALGIFDEGLDRSAQDPEAGDG